MRPERGQVPALAEHDPADGELLALLERLRQQGKGPLVLALRRHVIAGVEVDAVDLRGSDELLDVDRLGALRPQPLDLLRQERHVGVGRHLVALDDLLLPDLPRRRLLGRLILGGHPRRWRRLLAPDRQRFVGIGPADALMVDSLPGHSVDLVEADVSAPRGRVEAHRDVHEPEADRPGPDRAWHSL